VGTVTFRLAMRAGRYPPAPLARGFRPDRLRELRFAADSLPGGGRDSNLRSPRAKSEAQFSRQLHAKRPEVHTFRRRKLRFQLDFVLLGEPFHGAGGPMVGWARPRCLPRARPCRCSYLPSSEVQ